MNVIKVKNWYNVPGNYTGIVERDDGTIAWHKNDKLHREDGPAYIRKDGVTFWDLDGRAIWDSHAKLDLTNQIILSKTKHPDYPTVQVWKILNKNEVYEQIVVPGMEKYIQE